MSIALYALMKGDLYQLQANCMVAKLWRTILYDLNVSPSIWEERLRDYIEKAEGIIGKTEADRLKGNIPKSLINDHVSFQALCRAVTILRFKRVIFTVHTFRGEEHKHNSIVIPETYDGKSGGLYLKTLWVLITQAYPEVTANWSEYVKTYKERVNKEYGGGAVNLGGNITSTLNKDRITWKNFYDGLMIHGFDKIAIEVTLERSAGLPPKKIGITAS
ncbi:hypothetical protein [Vibrio phage BONAISHI]|nr:hypothetical protein [Vibrio phage BONAISHI]